MGDTKWITRVTSYNPHKWSYNPTYNKLVHLVVAFHIQRVIVHVQAKDLKHSNTLLLSHAPCHENVVHLVESFGMALCFFPLEDVGGIPFNCYTAELSCGCLCILYYTICVLFFVVYYTV